MINDPNPTPETPTTEDTAPAAAAASGRSQPYQHHQRQVDLFKQSLSAHGEGAYQCWGIAMLPSLEPEEAETQRQMLGFEPRDGLDFYNRGCLLAARGEFAKAGELFAEAVRVDPELVEAQFNQALALEQTGDLAGARKAWLAFIERNPDYADLAEIKQHVTGLAG